MQQVSANLNDLVQTLKCLQDGVRSIETTRNIIKTKYQHLEIDWNDSKYRQLGDILQSCNRALTDINKIMLQAEKYVASLIKTIQAYDSVSFGNGENARNTFMQGLRVDTSGQNYVYQYCLGVLTQGTIPNGYVNVLKSRHEKAETNVKKVFDYYAQNLMIRDCNYPPNETAHYAKRDSGAHLRGVYYNVIADMNNPKGVGTTYFHELAHMIDHASMNYQGNLSNTIEFGKALVEDGQRILKLFNSFSSEKQANFLYRIRQDSAHSFSDLIDATTNGQLYGRYGHTAQYWTYSGNLQAEAFAHFFEASMGDEAKIALLANFFPTAFEIFTNMIESILPLGDVRTRTLER